MGGQFSYEKDFFFLLVHFSLGLVCFSQSHQLSSLCSAEEIFARLNENDPDFYLEILENEEFTRRFVSGIEKQKNFREISQAQYVIPVVLHVFHNEEDGKMDLDQARSGIKVINEDFNGMNEDWNTVDPSFESVKSKLNLRLCLATIDPQGNPTSGVIYYENDTTKKNTDLFSFAWDNYKYLNIYLRKHIYGEPSKFSGYTDYPSRTNSESGRDGIFMSSVRWGYGAQSELELGDEWASVATHELGHWLNLFHTFDNGCSFGGDKVSDTPSTLGGELFLSGCNNNDFSCGESTNGENYMDYNVRCRKMFTQGQVDRMKAALNFSTRNHFGQHLICLNRL